jgi:hypothetical protein
MIEIKNRFTGDVIISGEYESVKELLANLSGANLSGADLSRANLSRANLSEANLYGANLSGANLSEANLSGADLSGANLSGADLSRANLSRANLSGADLSRANLSRANLSRANLSEANLYGANLSGANLSEANLSGAFGILSSLSIFGSKHFVTYYMGKISIGCKSHTVQEWIDDAEAIGVENGYTVKQILEYKGYIMLCKQFHDNLEENNHESVS